MRQSEEVRSEEVRSEEVREEGRGECVSERVTRYMYMYMYV